MPKNVWSTADVKLHDDGRYKKQLQKSHCIRTVKSAVEIERSKYCMNFDCHCPPPFVWRSIRWKKTNPIPAAISRNSGIREMKTTMQTLCGKISRRLVHVRSNEWLGFISWLGKIYRAGQFTAIQRLRIHESSLPAAEEHLNHFIWQTSETFLMFRPMGRW